MHVPDQKMVIQRYRQILEPLYDEIYVVERSCPSRSGRQADFKSQTTRNSVGDQSAGIHLLQDCGGSPVILRGKHGLKICPA